jgi:hypothetical protein
VTKRWLSQDPLGFGAGDSNLYRYVSNQPSMTGDSIGLFPDENSYSPKQQAAYKAAKAAAEAEAFDRFIKASQDRSRDIGGFNGRFTPPSFPSIDEWVEQDRAEFIKKALASPSPIEESLQWKRLLEDIENGQTLTQQFDKDPNFYMQMTMTKHLAAKIQSNKDSLRMFMSGLSLLPGGQAAGFMVAFMDLAENGPDAALKDSVLAVGFVWVWVGGRLTVHHIVSRYANAGRGWEQNWSALSREILREAGIGLESKTNKIPLRNHWEPHPEEYHLRVYRRLDKAAGTLEGEELTRAIRSELERIGRDLQKDPRRLSGGYGL